MYYFYRYFEEQIIVESEKYTFEKRETSFKMKIKSIGQEDLGKYTVKLENEMGEVSSCAELREMVVKADIDEGYQPPIMPLDKPFMTNIGDNYFTLNWCV